MNGHPAESLQEPHRWLRGVPNLLTITRIVASPLAIWLAWLREPVWFVALVAALLLTEFLDGFLARALHATSALGARLDTIADAVFYSSMLLATIAFRPRLATDQAAWIVLAIGSYSLSWLYSLWKFRCLPSYHTWAAKGAWGVVGMGIILLLFDVSVWPFRIATVVVALANFESLLITKTLAECRVDVPTLWHAKRITDKLAGHKADETR